MLILRKNKIFLNLSFKAEIISFCIFLIVSSCEKVKDNGLPIDSDGNRYDTIVIGNQTWFVNNLRTTKYKNGDPIYLVTDNNIWSSSPAGAYCWYENIQEHKFTYGALYNYKVASSDFICPDGWHVPTSIEWSELIEYLGGSHYAGGKLKETGIIHWIYESQGTTNETGFTALPGGCRYLDGTFRDINEHGYWWMSDIKRYVTLHYSNSMSGEGSWIGAAGYSIRCIKNK